MKIKIVASLFLVIAIFPSVALASWWNPFSWGVFHRADNQTQVLENRIKELENRLEAVATSTANIETATTKPSTSVVNKEIKKIVPTDNSVAIQAQAKALILKAQAVAKQKAEEKTEIEAIVKKEPLPATATQKDAPFDYGNYAKTSVSYYTKNPSNFLGWGTQVLVARVVDFLPTGTRSVDSNFIEIADANSKSSIPEKIMVQFESQVDYEKFLYVAEKGDLINVWGVGVPSQKFNTVGSPDTVYSYEPVIKAQRIDKCRDDGQCGTGKTAVVFGTFKTGFKN